MKLKKRLISALLATALLATNLSSSLIALAANSNSAGPWQADLTDTSKFTAGGGEIKFEDNKVKVHCNNPDGHWMTTTYNAETPMIDINVNTDLFIDIEIWNGLDKLLVTFDNGSEQKEVNLVKMLNGTSWKNDFNNSEVLYGDNALDKGGMRINRNFNIRTILNKIGDGFAPDANGKIKITKIVIPTIYNSKADFKDVIINNISVAPASDAVVNNEIIAPMDPNGWSITAGLEGKPWANEGKYLTEIVKSGSELMMRPKNNPNDMKNFEAEISEISWEHPVKFDINTLDSLIADFSIDNGFEIMIQIRNPETFEKVKINLNEYLTVKGKANGTIPAEKDKIWGSHYSDKKGADGMLAIKATLSLKEMIKHFAAGFVIPADGVLELCQFRVLGDWPSADKGVNIKNIRFANSNNNVTSASLNGTNGVVTQPAENANGTIKFSSVGPLTAITPLINVPYGATISPAGAQDFSAGKVVTYTVTSQIGTTKKYDVSVDEIFEGCSITKAVAGEYQGVIAGTTITFNVNSAFDLTSVAPTFTLSEGATISPSQAQDFTKGPITYTVTAQSGQTSDYTVQFLVMDNGCDIVSAKLNGIEGSINGNNIKFVVPYKTDITAMTPEFVLSPDAVINPITAQNFTKPVEYTVTAEDGTQKKYTVTVEVSSAPAFVNVDMKKPWLHTEGDGIGFESTGYSESKNGAYFDANKSGTWANVDYQGLISPTFVNINSATHFHFDITAGNGWNLFLLLKANGQEVLINTNKFIATRDSLSGDYYGGTYKDSLPIKEMIAMAKPEFVIPENGVVELALVRTWVGYHAEEIVDPSKDRDASVVIRYLAIDNADATNTVGKDNAVKPYAPKDFYEANFAGNWNNFEGEITFNPSKFENNALVVSTNKGGVWGNIDYKFGYGERITLNLNKASHFHFDITTANGFDMAFALRDKEGDVLYVPLNEYITHITGRGTNLYYKGTYKDSLRIADMVSYALGLEKNKDNKFNIPADGLVDLIQLRLHASFLEDNVKALEVRTFAFDNAEASNINFKPVKYNEAPASAYNTNLKGIWKHTEGPIEFEKTEYDQAKGGLYLKPNKAGDWANVDYEFGYKERIILNTNKSTHVHYDISAKNGWNIMLLAKDDKGNTLPVLVNNFKSETDNRGYTNSYYRGDYNGKFEIKKMIESAIKANEGTQFKMPANGVVEISQLRIWVGYHGDKDASIVLKKLNFNNENETNVPNTGVKNIVLPVAVFTISAASLGIISVARRRKTSK